MLDEAFDEVCAVVVLNKNSVFIIKALSDRTTALTTHTPLQPLYLTYEGPPKP